MSDKLKFVLVGCGRIATLHTWGYKDNAQAEIYGVFDKNEKKAESFAKEYDAQKVYKSYEEVLADPAVDAVELLVPHHLHCEMTIAACEAKKHVSVQKPMAMNLEECDRMIEAADRNGVKLKVFENFVFYPPYQLAKKMLDDGEIGEPVSIRYKNNGGGLGTSNMPGAEGKLKKAGREYDTEFEETGWKIDPATWLWRLNDSLSGGGPYLFDDGFHKFSIIMHMFGGVEKVFSWVDNTSVLPGVFVDCPAMIMWKHKSGKQYGVMEFVDSKDMYIKSKYYTMDERMEITGSRGVIWVTRCTSTMMPDVAPVIMYRDGRLTEYWDMPTDWGDSFKNSTIDFIDAIINDREPVLSGQEAKEVLKFSLSAIESSRQNHEIYLDEYADAAPRKKSMMAMFGKRK